LGVCFEFNLVLIFALLKTSILALDLAQAKVYHLLGSFL